jgi:hypothetical protein
MARQLPEKPRSLFASGGNLVFSSREKLLAGEARTLLLLVVGVPKRGENKLDGRPQLHGAK